MSLSLLLASINDFSLEGLNLITIFVRQSKTMWFHALNQLLEVTKIR